MFGHLRSFKRWIQTEDCVIPSYHGMLTEKQIVTVGTGRTRETRGKVNNGILIIEHRIHNYIDERTDQDSGETQGL